MAARKMSGVMVKASPVEVATPYFGKRKRNITKGIAIHIHKHSEGLRKKFVSHEAKMELTVIRDQLDLTVDDWSEAFKEFHEQLEATLTEEGKVMVSAKFSTTSQVMEDVSCIALMDAMSKYYQYQMICICGIPSVTLLGNREDWIELRNRSQHVLDLLSCDDLKGDVSLSWWKPLLLAVLDKLIKCYDDPELVENTDWMARTYKSEDMLLFVVGSMSFFHTLVNVLMPKIIKLTTGPVMILSSLNLT